MKKTNLPFQLCSTLSVNLILQWMLFISMIRGTPWKRSNPRKRANFTQKTLEELRSVVPWTRRTSEKLLRHTSWMATSDLWIQGKNTIHQDVGVEEQAQPSVEKDFSRKQNVAHLSPTWTVRRNHDSPFWGLSSSWKPQSMLQCIAPAVRRSPDWR